MWIKEAEKRIARAPVDPRAREHAKALLYKYRDQSRHNMIEEKGARKLLEELRKNPYDSVSRQAADIIEKELYR